MNKRERTMVCGWIDAEPEYIRADHVDALLKAEREKVLRTMWASNSIEHEAAILALISKDKTDG